MKREVNSLRALEQALENFAGSGNFERSAPCSIRLINPGKTTSPSP